MRRNSIYSSVLVFVVVLFLMPTFNFAAPTVTYTEVFTENFGTNSIEGYISNEWRFMMAAGVNSTVAIDSVWAYANTSGQPDYELEFQYFGSAYDSYYGTSHAYTTQIGTWDITATDEDGAFDTDPTHDLNDPMQLDLVTGINFSNNSTTPTITWNSVTNAEKYRVVLMRSATDHFWKSDWSNDTTASIDAGVLSPGETVFVRVQAGDFESPGVLENRSSAFEEFSTVPIPGAVWLLGSGLIGLLGLRKKFKS